jgi:hypothetical protein
MLAVLPLVMGATAAVSVGSSPPASTLSDLQIGNVVASVQNNQHFIYDNSGVFVEAITGDALPVNAGGFFDVSSNALYMTTGDFGAGQWSIIVRDAVHPHALLQTIDTDVHGGQTSESIVFDAAGNFYVGHADGDQDIKKFNAAGVFQQSFDVATDVRGSDWIDLADDQMTMYYTGEGDLIKRYDVLNDVQLPDFANLGNGSQAYAFRLLPPFDGTGGLIVADTFDIRRLDGAGATIQVYDAAGEDGWFAMNLDPNGSSFWAGSFGTDNFYRFNIATGAVEIGPINAGPGFTLFGLFVVGEITGGQAPPVFDPPSPCGQTLGAKAGVQMTFTVQASATNMQMNPTVSLDVTGAPAGGVFNPPLPAGPGQPVSSVFTWTPTCADVGMHNLLFTATDQLGQTATCDVTLDVSLSPPENICFGDNAAACPCGNVGAAGNGCGNSAFPGGSNLSAVGDACVNADTIVFMASDVRPSTLVLLFQGNVETAPNPISDGAICVGGTVRRLWLWKNQFSSTMSGPGNNTTIPDTTGQTVSGRSAQVGDPLTNGATRIYQAWYRDPPDFGCAFPATSNYTNAVRILWSM